MQRCVVSGWLLWAFVGAQIVFPDSNRGGSNSGNSGGSSGFDPCRLCPCNGGTYNIPCPPSCCSNSISRPVPNTPRPSVNRPSSCSAGCFQCFRPGQGQASCGSGCCRNNFIQPTRAPVQQTCPAGCFRCNQFFSGQEAPCFSGNGCCRRVQNQNNQNALILPNFPTNPTQRPTPQTPFITTARPTRPPTRPVSTTTSRPTSPPTTTPRTTTTTKAPTTTPIPTTPRTTTTLAPETCKQGCAPCGAPSRLDEFICSSSCCIIVSPDVSTTQAPPVTSAPTCSAGCFSCSVAIPGVQTSCGQGCCRNVPQPTSAPNQCSSSCSPCESPSIVDQITCGFSCCIRTQLSPNVNQLFGGKEYHFSWLHDGNQKYTQGQAANYCARLPGDWSIISIETRGEDNFVNSIITTNRLDYIWTGASRTASGWRWPSGAPFQQLNWSTTGGAGVPQPDNREPGGENCLSVLNNVYNDGVKWHDIGCSHTKPTICER